MTMMGIVERLRTFWRLNNCGPGVLLEAADEIERLRKAGNVENELYGTITVLETTGGEMTRSELRELQSIIDECCAAKEAKVREAFRQGYLRAPGHESKSDPHEREQWEAWLEDK